MHPQIWVHNDGVIFVVGVTYVRPFPPLDTNLTFSDPALGMGQGKSWPVNGIFLDLIIWVGGWWD